MTPPVTPRATQDAKQAWDVVREAKAVLNALDAAVCPDCDDPECGWDRLDRLEKLAADLVPELIAEVERLRAAVSSAQGEMTNIADERVYSRLWDALTRAGVS